MIVRHPVAGQAAREWNVDIDTFVAALRLACQDRPPEHIEPLPPNRRYLWLSELTQATAEYANAQRQGASLVEAAVLAAMINASDNRAQNTTKAWELIGEIGAYWWMKTNYVNAQLVHGYLHGHQGIDQLWVDRPPQGPIARIFVVEAKGGTGALQQQPAYLVRENVHTPAGVAIALADSPDTGQMRPGWIYIGADYRQLGGRFTAAIYNNRTADLIEFVRQNGDAALTAAILCLHYAEQDVFLVDDEADRRNRFGTLRRQLNDGVRPGVWTLVITNGVAAEPVQHRGWQPGRE